MRGRLAILLITAGLAMSWTFGGEITVLDAWRDPNNGSLMVEWTLACPSGCPPPPNTWPYCCAAWSYSPGVIWDGGPGANATVSTAGDCGGIYTTHVTEPWTLDTGYHSLAITAFVRDERTTFCDEGHTATSNAIIVWEGPLPSEGISAPDKVASHVGCPVDVATGKMYHEMTDMTIAGPLPIAFTRRYTSSPTGSGALGSGWQHNYMVRLTELGNAVRHMFINEEMREVPFVCKTADTYGTCIEWAESPYEYLSLTYSSSQWHVSDKHGKVYDFDGDGTLLAIHDRHGNTTTLGYDQNGYLTSISDDLGRSITLTNSSGGILQSISAGSRTVTYTVSGGDLTRVQYPDINSANDSFVTYEYSSHKMTAAKDALGKVIESHTYTNGRVTHTESEGGTRAYDLSYDSSTQTTVTNGRSVQTVYTLDPIREVVTDRTSGPGCSSCGGGTSTHFRYDWYLNPFTVTDGNDIATKMTYDGMGNMLTRTEGVTDENPDGERMWAYTYESHNFPATISIPSVSTCSNSNKVITNTYNSSGDLCNQRVSGCSGSAAFCYETFYEYDGHGQLTKQYNPRDCDGDATCTIPTSPPPVTTYAYYGDGDGTAANRGRLQTVTNALNQVTTYGNYDVFGNVGSVTDPNNVQTTYVYDGGGRVTETRVHGATSGDDIVTTNEYDSVGRLYRVKLPNCVGTTGCDYSMQYTYVDGVGWLKEVYDHLENRIEYSYDPEGDATAEKIYDNNDVLKKSTLYAYTAYNQLWKKINPDSSYTLFTYDDAGNLASVDDANHPWAGGSSPHQYSYTYDALNRLKTATVRNGGVNETTTYGYDVRDSLTSIVDGDGRSYGETYDDLKRNISTASPDWDGTASRTFDPAGNLLTETDARAITSSRTYDDLNRLTYIEYGGNPYNVVNVSFSYDDTGTTNGVGRLTGMSDESGSTAYTAYDRRGLLLSVEQTVEGMTYATGYTYDKNGNRTSMTYPSGKQYTYGFNLADRPTSITASINDTPTTLLSNIAHYPFGPLSGASFSSGKTLSRTYDTGYAITGNTVSSNILALSYLSNHESYITKITDGRASPGTIKEYTYDDRDQLLDATAYLDNQYHTSTLWGSESYAYDKNGNRQSKNSTGYYYATGRNRLTSTTSPNVSYDYDADGDTTSDGTYEYSYGDHNRLSEVTANSGATFVAAYKYDGFGRRIEKVLPNDQILFYFYDIDGRLITETGYLSEVATDHVYLDGEPVVRVNILGGGGGEFGRDSSGQLMCQEGSNSSPGAGGDVPDPDWFEVPPDTLYFYHNDHLATPVAMTNASGSVVWRAEYRPFGDSYSFPVAQITNNLRFPGQYFDSETGLHQNWFREYSPSLGKYTAHDPLRQLGGLNPFRYSSGNPVNQSDRLGLWTGSAIGWANPSDPRFNTTWAVFGYVFDIGRGAVNRDLASPPLWFNMLASAREAGPCGTVKLQNDFFLDLVAGHDTEAMTLGNVIVLRRTTMHDKGIIDHELVHVAQVEELGPYFYPLYVFDSGLNLYLGLDYYWDNAFEIQARNSAGRVRPRYCGCPE